MEKELCVLHHEWKGIVQLDDQKAFFVKLQGGASLADSGFAIVLGGILGTVSGKSARTSEAVRREREVFQVLKEGGLVCITCMYDELIGRVLKRLDIKLDDLVKPRADIVTKRSEFSAFLARFGAADFRFDGEFDDVICETEDRSVVGFAKKVGKGVLIFLPVHVLLAQYGDPTFMREMARSLFNALKAYSPRIRYKLPGFVNDFRFPKEQIIISEFERLRQEISKKEKALGAYPNLKEVLWFRNNELVDSVINFLAGMKIQTKKDEIYEEDFWIMEQNEEKVIVEVKGLDRNLKRPHISRLDEHRGAREKPDDFPALMIVNSFNIAGSLEEKDKPISANEIKKAVRTNVLILRTLDLCNAYSLLEEGKLKVDKFLEAIKNETGWLRVTSSGLEVKHS